LKYLTYGDKRKKSIVLIHGMATTAPLCYERIIPYLDYYYVVLVQVDGHIEGDFAPLLSVEDACTDIERYITTELGGNVFCLSGFSMGGTMAVEIAGRGNVGIEKLFIDAAFLTQMGTGQKWLYKRIFWSSIKWLSMGFGIPDFLLDAVMGEDNRAVIQMLYKGVCKKTIYNACEYVYTYSIREEMRNYSGDAMFIYGQNEPYPRRSAALLKSFLPSLQINEIRNMGHGQYLFSQPEQYANLLLDFMEGKSCGKKSLSDAFENDAGLIKLKCEQCGAPLELDIDNLIAFCPHCGSKSLIDSVDLQKVMIEKEQTKRQERRYEHDLEMQKMQNENDKAFWKKAILIMVLFFGIFIILVILGTLA